MRRLWSDFFGSLKPPSSHRCSRGHWRFWRHEGSGPKSAKLGRIVVYREADVVAWIDAQFEVDGKPAA